MTGLLSSWFVPHGCDKVTGRWSENDRETRFELFGLDATRTDGRNVRRNSTWREKVHVCRYVFAETR